MFNRLVVAIVFVLLLFPASWVAAQVEFDIVVSGATTPTGSFRGLSEEQKVIVDFLFLTQKHEFCTSNLSPRANAEITICVFQDPTAASLQHLYIGEGGWYVNHVVLYNEEIVAVLSEDNGIGNLVDGEYIIKSFYNYRGANDLLTEISFSIATELE